VGVEELAFQIHVDESIEYGARPWIVCLARKYSSYLLNKFAKREWLQLSNRLAEGVEALRVSALDR
jgi:hypothetical protein